MPSVDVHENSEYPYEPAHPRSLIWTSLPAEKMLLNVSARAVSTPHENSDYQYEPINPRSLIWTSLSADNFHSKSVFN